MSPAIRYRCHGCGHEHDTDAAPPFPCAQAKPGDDIDHVLVRELDAAALRFPQDDHPNPFVRYRNLLGAFQLTRGRGWPDRRFEDLVEGIDERIADLDGTGFRETPFLRDDALSRHLGFAEEGGVRVKDETNNVSGSHKARHLMGVALYLEVLRQIGGLELSSLPPLAVASCGNAALAAAIVARAADRVLDVFIPPDANPVVVQSLEEHRARLHRCPRQEGETGDPCYLRFREAVARGAVPFSCQGNENGLVIEGGQTLGFEMISKLVEEKTSVQHLFVQVGGGALATACIRAFREAIQLGVPVEMPRIYAVQAEAATPLARAYVRLARRIVERASGKEVAEASPARLAAAISKHAPPSVIDEELAGAARHRSRFMWPWEEVLPSAAYGIVDDETYDWLEVVRAMLETGGYPVTVPESRVLEARRVAHEVSDIRADATGTAGLAGLLEVRSRREIEDDERVAVIYSGTERKRRKE